MPKEMYTAKVNRDGNETKTRRKFNEKRSKILRANE